MALFWSINDKLLLFCQRCVLFQRNSRGSRNNSTLWTWKQPVCGSSLHPSLNTTAVLFSHFSSLRSLSVCQFLLSLTCVVVPLNRSLHTAVWLLLFFSPRSGSSTHARNGVTEQQRWNCGRSTHSQRVSSILPCGLVDLLFSVHGRSREYKQYRETAQIFDTLNRTSFTIRFRFVSRIATALHQYSMLYGSHLVSGQQYSMLYGSTHKNSHNSLKSWRIYKRVGLLQTLSTWLWFKTLIFFIKTIM